MRMTIHKPRQQHPPTSINHLPSLNLPQPPDPNDQAILYPDISMTCRLPCPIHNQPATNKNIKIHPLIESLRA